MFESHRRSRGWWLRVPTVLIVAGVVLLIPGIVLAAGTFTDDDNSVFEKDIEWLAEAGVTRGCNPPTNDRFCPDDPVTRGQMAAFMHRLSENRVVDAKTATAAEEAETATNADLLDGKDSTAFVEKGESNSVDSSMLTDAPGVAQSLDGSQVGLAPTATSLASVVVNAPAAGHVLVQATYQVVIDHSNGAPDLCLIDVSDTDGVLPSSPTGWDPDHYVADAEVTGIHSQMEAASRVFPVTETGAHTFYLVGQKLQGGCSIDDVALTALYVPVSYGN